VRAADEIVKSANAFQVSPKTNDWEESAAPDGEKIIDSHLPLRSLFSSEIYGERQFAARLERVGSAGSAKNGSIPLNIGAGEKSDSLDVALLGSDGGTKEMKGEIIEI